MSKKMMEAYVKAQHAVLTCKDNKERLRYTVAGIKDGKFYDHSGTDYGMFDEKAPDAVFIPESDLELSRITGSKLATITIKMQKFFDTYNGDTNENEDTKDETSDSTKKSDKDETTAKVEEVDTDAVEKACKKAIKKGDVKKAQKLIDKLGGHKKLQKKLDKAGKE